MKSEEFDKCRQFLETAISENPESNGFLEAYVKLMELKSSYDKETDKALIEKEIRQAEFNTQYNSTVHTNNTEYGKSVYQNNTDFNIAANNNQAASYQHNQTQQWGAVNNAMNNGFFPPQR
ncbi:hypothetical protein [Salinivibrio sp. AR640]|uniref:hypothetical protein n=1 Tax=Salinivibrio sp. AR640 TaxID=1909437 RepID=UPI0009877417|nr:hypothetical protein [Salinivibrio sp. AR640]OOE93141.1 hypothetical protein BZG75_07630 [Salinivibrio sp. AR640]